MTLWEALEKSGLRSTSAGREDKEAEPVVVYMRKEVVGERQLRCGNIILQVRRQLFPNCFLLL